jgi:hypothetical protein
MKKCEVIGLNDFDTGSTDLTKIMKGTYKLLIQLSVHAQRHGITLPNLSIEALLKEGFEGHELMSNAELLLDNRKFWSSIPEEAQNLREVLREILVKYNQATL